MQDRVPEDDRPAPRRRGGRMIAWTVAALGLVALLAAAWVNRGALLQSSSLFEPNSRKSEDRENSAQSPAGIGSSSVLINGIVEAISPEERLVVLSVGKDQSVQPGYIFYVRRGAEYIGKVRVTNVYDDLSGARIDSTLQGVEIRVGDQVSTSNRGN